MNTVNNRGFRYVAIAALFAAGIATTIATGGGGSGGVTPPTSPAEPTLNITADNGSDVASAVVIAIGLSFDLGDITGGNISAQPAGDLLSAPLGKGAAGMFKGLPTAISQVPESCAISGSVDVTITQANVNTITVGDRIVAVFADCDDGLGYIINGTVDITIAAIQGDILTDVFLLGMDVSMTDIVVTEGTSITTAQGDFTLTLDSLDFPVMRMSLSGDELQLGSDGEVVTLTGFDHALQVDAVTTELVANVLGRLDSSTLGGSIDYDTMLTIEAIGDNDPYVGEILVTGANDSSVRLVVIDSNNIRLEVDENGDGVVDAFIDTTWAALNGHEAPPLTDSAIDSETAPILAREVFNAMTGFGSVTVTAGAQFVPVAPFGQVDAMDVSGDFSALQIACNLSGAAAVSGFKAVTNIYSSGDSLDATFDACTRDGEKLDGSMGLSIASFDETPGDAYAVSATVVESNLRRVFGGSCFSGIGTFDTYYDFMFTSTGFIYTNSSTADFNVWAGGRSQQLAGASVSAQITVGQQPVVVTRESTGVMTSPDLIGSFSYQSVVADEFYADDDGTTGPYAGELLVTAADGSSMRMVAIDEFNVRLDLDFNGDSLIDQSIPTTYAALGYDDWLCQ
jgi:hypothetical protein